MSFVKYFRCTNKQFHLDETTHNKQFKKYLDAHKMKGPNRFPLIIINQSLLGVDPYNEKLTTGQKEWVIQECIMNPIYFIREVARDKLGNKFKLNPAIMQALYLYMHDAPFIFNVPNYEQRTDFCNALFLHSMMAYTGTKTYISASGFSQIDEIKFKLPDYIIEYARKMVCKIVSVKPSERYYIEKPGFSMIENMSDLIEEGPIVTDCHLKDIRTCVYLSQHSENNGPSCIISGSYIPNIDKLNVIHMKNLFVHGIFDFTSTDQLYQLYSGRDNLYLINMDLVEAELNVYQIFQHLAVLGVNKGIDTTVGLIKFFVREAFGKNYDDLDILEKLHCNKIYSELYSKCDDNIKTIIDSIYMSD